MNFFKLLVRSIRAFSKRFYKAFAGKSLGDKFICLLISFKFESRFFGSLATHFLDLSANNGFLTITLKHSKSQKWCTISLRVKNYADYFIFWEFLGGFYEPPEHALQIVDCGANIGLFAVHAALVFPHARITCFEPDGKNFKLLCKNLEQNNIVANCLQRGVWSSKISGFYHSRQAFDGFISLEPSDIPVDCEVPEIGPRTWLKMDIEGGEYEVLPVVLSSKILPIQISMEVHDFYSRGGKLRDLMKEKGYSLKIVTDGSTEPAFAEITAILNQS